MKNVKLPHVTIILTEAEGNAFAILGSVIKAMRQAGYSEAEINDYRSAATFSDYNHLLQVTMKYVNVE